MGADGEFRSAPLANIVFIRVYLSGARGLSEPERPHLTCLTSRG
jgi:hypothetical protein